MRFKYLVSFILSCVCPGTWMDVIILPYSVLSTSVRHEEVGEEINFTCRSSRRKLGQREIFWRMNLKNENMSTFIYVNLTEKDMSTASVA